MTQAPSLRARTPLSLATLATVAAALMTSPQADAAEYESEPRLFRIEDVVVVREDTYQIPLTIDVATGVLEGLGVSISLSGDAELGVLMEGESQLRWPVPDAPATVSHEITPLDDASFVAMSAGMEVDVSVSATVFGFPFSTSLASAPVEFTDRVDRFTPFLLPGQTEGPSEIVVEPEPASGQASLPLNLSGPSGIAGLFITVSLDVDPTAKAVVKGKRLDTTIPQGVFSDVFTTDGSSQTTAGVFPKDVELYEPAPELEMEALYAAEVTVEVGYNISVSLGVNGSVASIPVNLSLPLGDVDIPLFPEETLSVDFHASDDTSPWAHPLPQVDVGVDAVTFADVPENRVATQSVAVANRGQLDLELTVSVEGTSEVTAKPAELSVEADGSSSVVVTYNPDAIGSDEAVLVLTTSDPTAPVVRIPITASAGEAAADDLDTAGEFRDTGSEDFTTCGCDARGPGGGTLALLGGVVAGLIRRRRD